MDPQELVPLEAGNLTGLPAPRARQRKPLPGAPSCFRGPLRLCRLLALVIVLPSLFVLVPLYLRYRVYSGQMYPMSMTDMRLIDSKISTTWCQRQVVRSNATFNAFVVPSQPELMDQLVPVSMTRELELEDDMKEYWGFYLLRGSTVTVSACVRWPGASLIMIKGYKHLQNCAYIGDDSSEELDELLEANALGLLANDTLQKKIEELRKVDGKANKPKNMQRQKPGVKFHDPNIKNNVSSPDPTANDHYDVTDHDPKELRELLEHLHSLRQAQKTESLKNYRLPKNLIALPALHRHRDTNVDKDERRFLSFKDIDGNLSLPNKTSNEYDTQATAISDINKKQNSNNDTNIKPLVEVTKGDDKNKTNLEETDKDDKEIKLHIEIDKKDDIKNSTDDITTINEIQREDIEITESSYVTAVEMTDTDKLREQEAAEANSREVFEDVLKRLTALGDKGKRVLVRLHQTMGVEYKDTKTNDDIMSAVRGSDEELDRLRKVLVEAIDEEKTRPQREQKRREAFADARTKRQLMLGAEVKDDLLRQLNQDDEPRNLAAEEDLEPDGYAEHHVTLNETTALDMSNSEFWSSFSSSEEALLECEGLILNLPLTPHPACQSTASEAESMAAARANALTYRVPANGYYFFVFNSENEVQRNYIRARFDLQKTRYDVARTKLRECTNSTSRCDLNLDIFSSQKVVLEVPLRDNDSLWNEQFVIISECEPRTSIYLFCVIAVPILIIVFAFQ